jgi:hypothetical protein
MLRLPMLTRCGSAFYTRATSRVWKSLRPTSLPEAQVRCLTVTAQPRDAGGEEALSLVYSSKFEEFMRQVDRATVPTIRVRERKGMVGTVADRGS